MLNEWAIKGLLKFPKTPRIRSRETINLSSIETGSKQLGKLFRKFPMNKHSWSCTQIGLRNFNQRCVLVVEICYSFILIDESRYRVNILPDGDPKKPDFLVRYHLFYRFETQQYSCYQVLFSHLGTLFHYLGISNHVWECKTYTVVGPHARFKRHNYFVSNIKNKYEKVAWNVLVLVIRANHVQSDEFILHLLKWHI